MVPFRPCGWPWWPVRGTKQTSHSAVMRAPPCFPADVGYCLDLYILYSYIGTSSLVCRYQEEVLSRVNRWQGRTRMKDAPGNSVTSPTVWVHPEAALSEERWESVPHSTESVVILTLNFSTSTAMRIKENVLFNKVPDQRHLVRAIPINWDTGSPNWQVSEQS